MKKIGRKKWSIRDWVTFSVSRLVTITLFGGGMLYFFSSAFGIEPIRKVGDTADRKLLPSRQYLFCQPEWGICYELSIDFQKVETGVKRLYIDTSSYQRGGLSELVKTSETQGRSYYGCIAVTDTQMAAIIDYVGGVSCNVDKRISEICGGITLGYGDISGIAAIRIFEDEKENELLCLTMAEELLNKWCLILGNKRSFFRILDLSSNNLSYADYLPDAGYFERFGESG